MQTPDPIDVRAYLHRRVTSPRFNGVGTVRDAFLDGYGPRRRLYVVLQIPNSPPQILSAAECFLFRGPDEDDPE